MKPLTLEDFEDQYIHHARVFRIELADGRLGYIALGYDQSWRFSDVIVTDGFDFMLDEYILCMMVEGCDDDYRHLVGMEFIEYWRWFYSDKRQTEIIKAIDWDAMLEDEADWDGKDVSDQFNIVDRYKIKALIEDHDW